MSVSRKSIASIALASTLALGLSACGGNDSNTNTQSPTSSSVDASTAATPGDSGVSTDSSAQQTDAAAPAKSPIAGTSYNLSGQFITMNMADGNTYQIPAPAETSKVLMQSDEQSDGAQSVTMFIPINGDTDKDQVSSYTVSVMDYTNEPLTTGRFERTIIKRITDESEDWDNIGSGEDALQKVGSYQDANGTWTEYIARYFTTGRKNFSSSDVIEHYYVNTDLKVVLLTSEMRNQLTTETVMNEGEGYYGHPTPPAAELVRYFGTNDQILKRNNVSDSIAKAVSNGISRQPVAGATEFTPEVPTYDDAWLSKQIAVNANPNIVNYLFQERNDRPAYFTYAEFPAIIDAQPGNELGSHLFDVTRCYALPTTTIDSTNRGLYQICIVIDTPERTEEFLNSDRDSSMEPEETFTAANGEWIGYNIRQTAVNGDPIVIDERQRFINVERGIVIDMQLRPAIDANQIDQTLRDNVLEQIRQGKFLAREVAKAVKTTEVDTKF